MVPMSLTMNALCAAICIGMPTKQTTMIRTPVM